MDDSYEISGIAFSTPRKERTKSNRDLLSQFNESASISLDISQDLSFSRFDQNTLPNAPKKAKVFRIPKAPVKKAKPKYVCEDCGKGYVCYASFKNHVLKHKVTVAASSYPDRDHVMMNILKIAGEAMKKVDKSPASGDRGVQFQKLVTEVLQLSDSEQWKQFCCAIGDMILDSAVGEEFILPSKLLIVLVDRAEFILPDVKHHDALLLKLFPTSSLYDCDLQSQFLLEFVLNLIKEILYFISNTIRSSHSEQTSQVTDLDQDEREVVYYIGGSIMRGYFRIAFRYQSSPKWNAIMHTLKNNVITDQPVGDSAWTMALDRGGLVYVTRECQDFFIALTNIVYSLEKRDGSIDYMSVVKAVINSNVILTWDKMFSDQISETVSLDLMTDVIKCFCRAYGRGFAKKRLSNLRKGPYVSMPTRHLVATRKRK